jgi:hypothetical protein
MSPAVELTYSHLQSEAEYRYCGDESESTDEGVQLASTVLGKGAS